MNSSILTNNLLTNILLSNSNLTLSGRYVKTHLYKFFNKKLYNSYMHVDLMNYINEDDKRTLMNKRFLNMSPNDWGMSVGITNQYIQADLLKTIYSEVYDDINDIRNKGYNVNSNIYGFDFIFKKNNKFYTVQSKLRQVRGIDEYSCQVNISTSRRNKKSKSNAYKVGDFDYLFVSLVNIKDSYENRPNINNWGFSLIPVFELIDMNNSDYLVENVSSNLLNKYKINFIN